MSTTTGLVLRARSGFYTIATDEGDLVEARLRGRVKRERQASDLAVIGDRVTVERLPDGTGAIVGIDLAERRFQPPAAGPRWWREEVMFATGTSGPACSPAPSAANPRLIDRFSVVVEYNEVRTIVATRSPVGAEPRSLRLYRRIGYDVVYRPNAGVVIEELRGGWPSGCSIVTGFRAEVTLLNTSSPGSAHDRQCPRGERKGKHTRRMRSSPLGEQSAYPWRHAGHPRARPWQIPRASWLALQSFAPISGHARSTTHACTPRALAAAVESGSLARWDYLSAMLTGDCRLGRRTIGPSNEGPDGDRTRAFTFPDARRRLISREDRLTPSTTRDGRLAHDAERSCSNRPEAGRARAIIASHGPPDHISGVGELVRDRDDVTVLTIRYLVVLGCRCARRWHGR